MVRTSYNGEEAKLNKIQQVMHDVSTRLSWARRMGFQYSGERKLYQALGYPEEKDLVFRYYFNKYERQDIASAVIDRPVEATWKGDLVIVEQDKQEDESALAKAWKELDERLKVKQRLTKIDKLSGIGRYAILLFGFNDVKKLEDWKSSAAGAKKLVYLKQVNEEDAKIETWETNSTNKRYGQPKIYTLSIQTSEETGELKRIQVHHSRVLHIREGSLTSEVYGRPRLKPIVNRLEDLEKLLGGDAEMFWRGARPGYSAQSQKDYEKMDAGAIEDLQDQLDDYEHDLRRFLTTKGIDIKALEQQVADPEHHIDIQLQAISAQTGIPKRVLVGSERGELSSTQDKDQWLGLIKTRMDEYAEPEILRPFVDKCMVHNILPKVKGYKVIWEDVFAQSEADKVKVGVERAKALKEYAASPLASEILPPSLIYKLLLGLTEEQAAEVIQVREEEVVEEDRLLAEAEREARRLGKRTTEPESTET